MTGLQEEEFEEKEKKRQEEEKKVVDEELENGKWVEEKEIRGRWRRRESGS